jgi:hypothetical protein
MHNIKYLYFKIQLNPLLKEIKVFIEINFFCSKKWENNKEDDFVDDMVDEWCLWLAWQYSSNEWMHCCVVGNSSCILEAGVSMVK